MFTAHVGRRVQPSLRLNTAAWRRPICQQMRAAGIAQIGPGQPQLRMRLLCKHSRCSREECLISPMLLTPPSAVLLAMAVALAVALYVPWRHDRHE